MLEFLDTIVFKYIYILKLRSCAKGDARGKLGGYSPSSEVGNPFFGDFWHL